MYKSAHRFMQRSPGSRFWNEYASTYQLKAVSNEEVLISALADTLRTPGPRRTITQLTDYEVAGLAIVCMSRLKTGAVAHKLIADLDARLERDNEQISFSATERTLWEHVLEQAARDWKGR